MRLGSVALLALVAAIHVAAAEGPSSYHEVHVQRIVASPGPVADAAPLLSDASTFRLDLDAGVVVRVDADENLTAPFYLRYHQPGAQPSGSPLPSLHQSVLLRGPATWLVQVDPAAGAGVDVYATFRGFVGDPDGGAPAAFRFGTTSVDLACLQPGACLP